MRTDHSDRFRQQETSSFGVSAASKPYQTYSVCSPGEEVVFFP